MSREVEPWTIDEIARLAQLLEDGEGDPSISRSLDRTERAVAQKRRAMGWLRKPPIVKRRKVPTSGLEHRYRVLREYMELLVPLARVNGAHEVADLANEALAKADATDVRSPDGFPARTSRHLGVAG